MCRRYRCRYATSGGVQRIKQMLCPRALRRISVTGDNALQDRSCAGIAGLAQREAERIALVEPGAVELFQAQWQPLPVVLQLFRSPPGVDVIPGQWLRIGIGVVDVERLADQLIAHIHRHAQLVTAVGHTLVHHHRMEDQHIAQRKSVGHPTSFQRVADRTPPRGGAGGIESSDPLEGRWVSNDFSLGDVLIFHSMVVHKGVPNRSDKLRMSMDVRYQLVSEPFNIDNANADAQPLAWDDIYAGWRSKELQHYWQRLPLSLKEFDRTWFDKRDALGFALGEAGDSRARSVLQRIVARDADATKRARAQHLLDALDAA